MSKRKIEVQEQLPIQVPASPIFIYSMIQFIDDFNTRKVKWECEFNDQLI